MPAFESRIAPVRANAEPLTAEQWATLRFELPPHLQDMADFAMATGLRWDNVAMLEWSQVLLENRMCWVFAHQGKARKAISVPLSQAALDVLRRRELHADAGAGFVFTYNGAPIGSPKTAPSHVAQYANNAALRSGHKIGHKGVRYKL